MLPSRFFSELTQPEIAAQFKKNPLVILPAGSVEQHGPHLPTGTDTLAANMIAQHVADRPVHEAAEERAKAPRPRGARDAERRIRVLLLRDRLLANCLNRS